MAPIHQITFSVRRRVKSRTWRSVKCDEQPSVYIKPSDAARMFRAKHGISKPFRSCQDVPGFADMAPHMRNVWKYVASLSSEEADAEDFKQARISSAAAIDVDALPKHVKKRKYRIEDIRRELGYLSFLFSDDELFKLAPEHCVDTPYKDDTNSPNNISFVVRECVEDSA